MQKASIKTFSRSQKCTFRLTTAAIFEIFFPLALVREKNSWNRSRYDLKSQSNWKYLIELSAKAKFHYARLFSLCHFFLLFSDIKYINFLLFSFINGSHYQPIFSKKFLKRSLERTSLILLMSYNQTLVNVWSRKT